MSTESRTIRIAVVGAKRVKVSKILSLVKEELKDDSPKVAQNSEWNVEYLACTATFDTYKNEKGERVRYLMSIDYHGEDGLQETSSSLAPFFEEKGGIMGVAVGCGISSSQDVDRIEAFFQTLSSSSNSPSPTVDFLRPNAEFSTMKEEMEAFRAMDDDAKTEATHLGTIGPGKMARFVSNFTAEIISKLQDEEETLKKEAAAAANNEENLTEDETETEEPPVVPPPPKEIDPFKTRYACRICRTILFGEADLEDPPHIVHRHDFSFRKHNHTASKGCHSIFLKDGLDWMGDMSETEGKIHCPKCASKVGIWKWAGAQCSCGTWVTPAIQIPSSKVDEIVPFRQEPIACAALPSLSSLEVG